MIGTFQVPVFGLSIGGTSHSHSRSMNGWWWSWPLISSICCFTRWGNFQWWTPWFLILTVGNPSSFSSVSLKNVYLGSKMVDSYLVIDPTVPSLYILLHPLVSTEATSSPPILSIRMNHIVRLVAQASQQRRNTVQGKTKGIGKPQQILRWRNNVRLPLLFCCLMLFCCLAPPGQVLALWMYILQSDRWSPNMVSWCFIWLH